MPDYSNWQRNTAKNRDSLGPNPRSGTVAVAEMAMHRIVAPDHAGSIPVGHIGGSRIVGECLRLITERSLVRVQPAPLEVVCLVENCRSGAIGSATAL